MCGRAGICIQELCSTGIICFLEVVLHGTISIPSSIGKSESNIYLAVEGSW